MGKRYKPSWDTVKTALAFGGCMAVAVTASAWGHPIAEAITPLRDYVIEEHAPEIVKLSYTFPTVDKPEPEKPVGEDPREDELITAALVEQGYFRQDVPLDYTLLDILQTSCERYGVEYAVALGLIETESRFVVDAVSPAGCYGLCQLNPRYFPSGLSPEQNIETGIKYLGEQLEKYGGNLPAALTSYNAGSDTGDRTCANKVLAAAERWAS